MKATGIVRRLDGLGRFVIPMELRRMLKLENGDGIEVYMSDAGIVLKKYNPEPVCEHCKK